MKELDLIFIESVDLRERKFGVNKFGNVKSVVVS